MVHTALFSPVLTNAERYFAEIFLHQIVHKSMKNKALDKSTSVSRKNVTFLMLT
jgi:hypothetical protein